MVCNSSPGAGFPSRFCNRNGGETPPLGPYKFQLVSLLRETDLHIVFYIIAEIRPGFNAWGADFREFGPIPSPVKKSNRRLRRFFRFQPFLD